MPRRTQSDTAGPVPVHGQGAVRWPHAAATVDTDGTILTCTPGAARLLGQPPDGLVGHAATEFVAVGLPPSLRRSLAQHTEGSARLELRHRDGSGVEADVQVLPACGADGRREWIVTATKVHGDATALREWAFDQLPILVGVFGQDNRLVTANAEALRIMAVREEDVLGLRLTEMQPGRGYQRLDQLMEGVLRSGRPVWEEGLLRAPGETRRRAWSNFVYPLKDPTGRARGVAVGAFDITAQYRARQRLVAANEVGVRIGTTLDVARTVQELADVATGQFADFVAVDLLEPVLQGDEPEPGPSSGRVAVSRTAQQSVVPGCPESPLRPGQPVHYPDSSPMAHALASGKASLHRLDDPDLQRSLDPAQVRALRRLGAHSLLLVPLRARGTTLGLAHLVRHRNPEPFDADDLLLAEDVAARAALSVDNARRYTRERSTALALQRSMLPLHTPRQAAVEAAARYLPTGSRAGVGGDWYDVIPLSGARVALVVGDVVGHGLQASATMGRLRTAVRTLADVDMPPDELLTHLDDLVLRLDREEGPRAVDTGERESGDIGATCLYAVYDPASRRCTLARAGHPAPAIVLPDGTVDFPDLPAGPPLGLGGLPFESAELELPEGSLIALYTDGLIESADHDVGLGLRRLSAALTSAPASLEETCDHVVKALLPESPEDDIALLLARTRALDSSQVASWTLPSDPAVAAQARQLASDQLAVWGLDELAYVTELVVSELVTNAIRYGRPPIVLRLIHGTGLICEVSDASSTSPHLRRARVFDEGGRGLLLVAQLTDRWGTRHTTGGKTIWAEQRLPASEPGG
ncbi:SpoIIE family protein phosphatase [Streptomyces sp. NPDC002851]